MTTGQKEKSMRSKIERLTLSSENINVHTHCVTSIGLGT